jgi:hypothetical protein
LSFSICSISLFSIALLKKALNRKVQGMKIENRKLTALELFHLLYSLLLNCSDKKSPEPYGSGLFLSGIPKGI